MAKVEFINAIVSGKVAGGVYSRNKGGYYLKGFSMPLNPRSAAQVANRTRFGSAAGVWHSLTDIQKAQWTGYAITHYKPKGGLITSVRSGFQAFVALYNGALSAQQLARAATITVPAAITFTQDEFEPTQTAPSSEFSPMIQDSTGAPLALLLSGATFTAATAAITLSFDTVAEMSAAPKFLDAVGSVPCGIIAQLSKSMTQSQQFVSNPKMTLAASIKPPDTFTGSFSGHELTFSCAANDFNIANYKNWYSAGEKVAITAFLVGKAGQQAELGRVTVTVL